MATEAPACGPAAKTEKKALVRRPVTVTVTILSDQGDGTFEMDSNQVPIKKEGNRGPVLTFNNNQGGTYEDGFEVVFNLVDNTGKGYVFFQKPANPKPGDAMSVKSIDQHGYCPRRGEEWDGFTPTAVTNEQKTLVVDNPNAYPQYFGFAFHFSLPGQANPSLTYDPIGDDQNGENRIQ